MWLGIQYRMFVLFMRRVLFLFVNGEIKGFVWFFSVISVGFESEKMMYLLDMFLLLYPKFG